MAEHESALVDALAQRERRFVEALDRLRELASGETENEVCDLTRTLRDAVELTRCLRRLVPGRTANEIHRGFGAPGDWGYETPIGNALACLYRGATKGDSGG